MSKNQGAKLSRKIVIDTDELTRKEPSKNAVMAAKHDSALKKLQPQQSIFEIIKQIDGMQDDLNVKIDAVANADSCDKKKAAKKIF